MRADNSQHLAAAARTRSRATLGRAVAALRRMDTAGLPASFDAVAKQAGVSRSWLYTQPDLRTEIERLRQRPRPDRRQATVPDRQRCSDASLQRRLETAQAQVRHLHDDNRRLRAALAEALGNNRVVTARKPRRDTPTPQRISKVIGPCS